MSRGFGVSRIIVQECGSCLSPRQNKAALVLNSRLSPESTRVTAPDVTGSTGAAHGEGKAVNGELDFLPGR